jgi:hypothetical protein
MSRGPEQTPHHVSFQEPAEQRRRYPPPAQVAWAALAEIQPDGSVFWGEDEETGEPVYHQPEEPVDLEALAPDNYAHTLYEVARAISHTVQDIASAATKPDSAEKVRSDIEQLAHHLSGYRHDPAFIEHAASLTWFDERGLMHNPKLPQESPWEWVPKLRTELAYQNAAQKAAQEK